MIPSAVAVSARLASPLCNSLALRSWAAFRGIGDDRMLAYGVILLAVILFRPQGMFSIGGRLARAA